MCQSNLKRSINKHCIDPGRAHSNFALRREPHLGSKVTRVTVYSIEKDLDALIPSQVPTWRGDVVKGYIPRPLRVFCEGIPIRQLSIDRSIVHRAFTFHFYPDGDSLYSCSWPGNGCWEDWARKNTVRNRDTGLRLIETSQDI